MPAFFTIFKVSAILTTTVRPLISHRQWQTPFNPSVWDALSTQPSNYWLYNMSESHYRPIPFLTTSRLNSRCQIALDLNDGRSSFNYTPISGAVVFIHIWKTKRWGITPLRHAPPIFLVLFAPQLVIVATKIPNAFRPELSLRCFTLFCCRLRYNYNCQVNKALPGWYRNNSYQSGLKSCEIMCSSSTSFGYQNSRDRVHYQFSYWKPITITSFAWTKVLAFLYSYSQHTRKSLYAFLNYSIQVVLGILQYNFEPIEKINPTCYLWKCLVNQTAFIFL